jgi:hypothetical protein
MQTQQDEPADDFFEALMASYTDAWNREDIDAIESYYNVPFFSYKEGQLGVYSDPEQGRETDLDWIETNRREGPAIWERLNSSLRRQGLNSVLVTTHWAFTRPDGTAVWDFVDTFQICRFDAGWKFLNRTLHD